MQRGAPEQGQQAGSRRRAISSSRLIVQASRAEFCCRGARRGPEPRSEGLGVGRILSHGHGNHPELGGVPGGSSEPEMQESLVLIHAFLRENSLEELIRSKGY